MGDDKKKQLRAILHFGKTEADNMLRAAVDCYGNGEYEKAETLLVGLMSLDDTDPRPVKLLASTLALLDRQREAESMYELALELDADDPYTLAALGELKLKSLRIAEAIPIFERLFALDPEGKNPAANRGRDVVQKQYVKLAAMVGPKKK